jgi:GNAT superfamily N-acetyltransferase
VEALPGPPWKSVCRVEVLRAPGTWQVMGELVFERADERDAPGIQRVAAESWRATYKDIFADDVITSFLGWAYSTESLRRAIRNPRAVFLVVKDGDRVVGFCHFGEGRGPELYRMYLLPDYWRRGIGTRFVALVKDEWRARGVSEYFCVVHGRNEIGKAFYLKHGFVHVPERDAENGWRMVKRIEPERALETPSPG